MDKEALVLYKRLLQYMRVYWGKFLISITAMIIAAATEPAFAHLMKYLINGGFVNKDKKIMILIPILVVIVFLIRAIASFINETTTGFLSGSIVETMRNKMFDRLLHLPVSYYDDANSGRMLSRIVFDVTQITDAGFNIITVTIKDGFTVIGILLLLVYIDWQLTLFCFITLPFILVLIRILAKRLRGLSHNNQKDYGNMTQIITEAVSGQKVVKLYDGYNYEFDRFKESVTAIKNNNVKQAATASLNSGLSQFLVACSLSLILFFATTKTAYSNFTAGDFVSFLTALLLIFAPMKRITNVTQSLQRGLAAAHSVFSFLDTNIEENQGNKLLEGFHKSINFNKVSFKYPSSENYILTDINLDINVGEAVALVGSSGSGKTTIANLIPRFYVVKEGNISIDGINLNEIDLQSLRSNIALVSQDVVLFNDTVFNNIVYGSSKKINFEEVKKAAIQANALDFINDLAKGFDTKIGEHGTKLSGGQKQRLAIARALYKNAPLLILDEATSALDNQSEKLVQEALEHLMKNRTTIIIAHRLSTIINANKIVVLDKGKVVEVGKHQELLNKNGYYANLYNIQNEFLG